MLHVRLNYRYEQIFQVFGQNVHIHFLRSQQLCWLRENSSMPFPLLTCECWLDSTALSRALVMLFMFRFENSLDLDTRTVNFPGRSRPVSTGCSFSRPRLMTCDVLKSYRASVRRFRFQRNHLNRSQAFLIIDRLSDPHTHIFKESRTRGDTRNWTAPDLGCERDSPSNSQPRITQM